MSGQVGLNDGEISLLEILRFLKGALTSIATAGVAGLVISVVYLALTPKQYQAITQISMAQISATNNSLNPLGINIEEPSLLISRLSSPTSFTPQAISGCDVGDFADPGASLSKSIKLAPLKGIPNVVELKVFGKSPEAADICAKAIFELIKTTQAQLVAPYIADTKVKLDDDMERLSKAKEFVAKADRSGSAMGAAYLSTRDEIRFLLDEITVLKNVVTTNQSRATRLITPIYVSDVPVAPNKLITLIGGLFGGLFFGLLFCLVRKSWAKLKAGS